MNNVNEVPSQLSQIKSRGSVGFKEIADMKLGINSCWLKSAEVEVKGDLKIPHIKLKFENVREEFVLDFLRTSNVLRFEQSFHRIKYLFKGTKFQNEYNEFNPMSLLQEPSPVQKAQLIEVYNSHVAGIQLNADFQIEKLNAVDQIQDEMSDDEIAQVYKDVEADLTLKKRTAYENGFEPIELQNGNFGLFLFPIESRNAQLTSMLEDFRTLITDEHNITLEIKKNKQNQLNVTKYLVSKI
tara:strand:+ start:1236 stop:1958 length:723 start_codon:yes stop_codon:yes gene_type:complete